MSKQDPPNPFEEIQRQLDRMLRNANVSGASPGASETGEEPPSDADGGDDGGGEREGGADDRLEAVRSFHLKPKEIRDHLERYVIQQQEAKKVLSVAICDHYNHVRLATEGEERKAAEYSKQNILLLGPTGVGKTYLIRNIARLIGVPFVKADATKFSETGYIGGDVEDLARDLVKSAEGDVELAEYGIIFLDEIDKLAVEGGAQGRDVSGRGVQTNLLKLMEETEVNLVSPSDMMGQMRAMMEMQRGGKEKRETINTRNILFIVSGAFENLSESVKKRVQQASIGFGAEPPDADADPSQFLKYAETNDFIQYGFEPEFIGRLPVRVACEALSAHDLARILTSSEGSILNQYYDDFAGHGIDLRVQPEAIQRIAEKASSEGTGARGLMTVLERLFRDFKYELPSTAIREFELAPEMVDDPERALDELLNRNAHLQQDVWKRDIARFARAFQQKHGLHLQFTDGAMEALVEEAGQSERTMQAICEDKFRDYEHGLKIIERNAGQTVFKIGKLAVQQPDNELSKWVVRSIEQAKQTSGSGSAPSSSP